MPLVRPHRVRNELGGTTRSAPAYACPLCMNVTAMSWSHCTLHEHCNALAESLCWSRPTDNRNAARMPTADRSRLWGRPTRFD